MTEEIDWEAVKAIAIPAVQSADARLLLTRPRK